MIFKGGSFFSPSGSTLVWAGAKDPSTLASGQWWRLLSALVVHGGVIHLLLNNMALRVIGPRIEGAIGSMRFLLVYVASGLAGNIWSSYSHSALGMGASGAIFGLIGVGVVFEWLWLYRLSFAHPVSIRDWILPGPFSFMVWLNLAISIIFNEVVADLFDLQIEVDNFAHLGGMFAGIGMAAFWAVPNYLSTGKMRMARVALIAGAIVALLPLTLSILSPAATSQRLIDSATDVSDIRRKYFILSQAVEIDSQNPQPLAIRIKFLLEVGELQMALNDVRALLALPGGRVLSDEIRSELSDELQVLYDAFIDSLGLPIPKKI